MIGLIFYLIVAAVIVALTLACGALYISLTAMPYVTGFLASAVLCAVLAGNDAMRMISAHHIISFFIILSALEVVVFILLHIPSVGKAVRIALSEIMVALISGVIFKRMMPETFAACFIMTAAYLLVTIVILLSNSITEEAEQVEILSGGSLIGKTISWIIYLAVALMIIAIPAKLIWLPFVTGS